MGKYRPVILLGAAIIVAFIASYLIYDSLQKRVAPKEAKLQTRPTAVAVIDLPWGTALKKEMVRLEPFLIGSLPGGSFSDTSLLDGRVVLFPIGAREPILESRLAPITVKTGGIAAVVKPKMRAVAVKVDKVIGVAGFIYPNNRVDVLVTITPKQQQQDPITKIVLENILVLAAGPEMQKTGKDEKAAPVDVITLEVTPEEAEKLALAATEGKLQLALRNFSDNEDVLTLGAKVPALLASYSGSGKAVVPRGTKTSKVVSSKPGKPAAYVVELITGGKKTTLKFEGGK
jgi:pilus assembly protein CpaB